MGTPPFGIARLAAMYRAGRLKLDEANQGFQDMHVGRDIRGVVLHES